MISANPSDVEELGKLDPALGMLMERCGPIEIALQEDYFLSIASAIVGQQLSNRVAEVLWSRLVELAGETISPERILHLEDEALRLIGISYSKIKYLKALATAVVDHTLELDQLPLFDDEEVIWQLTRVKGIGPWTAEMFLIFSMGRMDVFSVGDGRLPKFRLQTQRLQNQQSVIMRFLL